MNSIIKLTKKILPKNIYQFILKIYIFSTNIFSYFYELILIRFQPFFHKIAIFLLRKKAKKGKKIKVIFFVIHSSVWKYDEIYHLFLNNERFLPLIIICPGVNFGPENMKLEIDKAYSFFLDKKYNVIKAYDSKNNTYLNVKKDIKPDIIFYTNPYKGLIDNKFYITKFYNYLTCYVQYTFSVFDSETLDQNNLLFHNILWKRFQENKHSFKNVKTNSRNKGINAVLTGYPATDKIKLNLRINSFDWKNNDLNFKRIVWAPHHTIEDDNNSASTFLQYSDFFIKLAHLYKNRIQLSFRPHPLLKIKLLSNKIWNQTKIDNYFEKWKNLSNGFYSDGDYTDLFNSSDALIHDCGSFIAEYFYTGKPVMFLHKNNNHMNRFNDFGKKLINLHYSGFCQDDIINFIEKIIIEGNDYLRKSRNDFFIENFEYDNSKTSSFKIYSYITKIIGIK